MRKSFVRAVGALAVVAALASAGCGRSTTTEATDSGGARTGTVGIAMPTKSSERWVADGNNMAEQFQKLGYKTDLQYGDDVVQNQVSQIENMITKGVKVLVIAPIDGSSLTDILQRAADAKIPVISYDRLIRGTAERRLLRDLRQLQGRRAAGAPTSSTSSASQQGKGPFNIELFAGSPDDNNATFFFNGAMSVLTALHRQRQARRQERPDHVRPGRHAALGRRTRPVADGQPAEQGLHQRPGRRGALPLRRHVHRHHLGAEERGLRHAGQAAADRHRPGRRARLGEVDHRGRADPDRVQGHPRAGEGRCADGRLAAHRQASPRSTTPRPTTTA